jgi:hypothetical protein
MTGSCQKKEAVARLETSYWQRQLPELKKKGADHFSRLSGIYIYSVLKNDGKKWSRLFILKFTEPL